jgi:hypothetical protein
MEIALDKQAFIFVVPNHSIAKVVSMYYYLSARKAPSAVNKWCASAATCCVLFRYFSDVGADLCGYLQQYIVNFAVLLQIMPMSRVPKSG